MNLSNGFRLRRNGCETTWPERGDVAEFISAYNAQAIPFFESAATLGGIENYFVTRIDQGRGLSLRQSEHLFYCLLLQSKYVHAFRTSEDILGEADGELQYVYRGKPDPTDWRVRLKAEISNLRDLLLKQDIAAIERRLTANERVSYEALSWPPECIDAD